MNSTSEAIANIKEPLFWASTVVSVILGILAVIGNGIVIYIAAKKKNMGSLRYLNEAVVSLAVTDFLTGVIGFPPTIVYYYWDLTDQFSKLENWKLEAIWLVPNILTTSTCLHALLLTSLRLLSLELPLQFKSEPTRPKTDAETGGDQQPTDGEKLTAGLRYLTLHGFHTIPLLVVIVLYFRVFCKANRSTPGSRNINFVKNKKAARLTGGIVFLILISYIPYLAQWQMDILIHRHVSQMSTGTLVFSWIGRCLMQINSCINPFIYAIILPSFRHFVNARMSLFRSRRKSDEVKEEFRRKMALIQAASQSETAF